MADIGIVIGSTRPGRRAETVGRWILDSAGGRDDIDLELLDLIEFGLPMLDEPVPAAMGEYRHPHTRAWADRVAHLDGFVFVTPEYNHSAPAALKNAIDFLFAEWHDKAAGFVSYGLGGGRLAVEHLRAVMAEVKVADVRTQVALSLRDDFDTTAAEGRPVARPRAHQADLLDRLLDEVVAWADALAPLRQEA